MKTCHSAGYFKQLILFLLLSLTTFLGVPGNALALTGNQIDRCSDCHGSRATNDVRPIDGVRNSSTGAVVGYHRTHMGSGVTVNVCNNCHVLPDTLYHRDGKISFQTNINNSNLVASYLKASGSPPFVNQTSVPTTTNAKCSNVNCHFESLTPVWTQTTSSVTCNSCHNSLSQGHTKHLAKYTEATNCSRCHPNYSTFQHATSAFNTGRGIKVNTEHAYTGSNYLFLPSQASQRVFGSCNTATCHTPSKSTPVAVSWNATLGCNGCHPNLSGAHARHIGNLANAITYYNYTANISVGTDSSDTTRANYGFGCSNCHPVDTAKHIDGNIDVALSTVENSFDVSTKVGKLRKNSGAAASTVGTVGNGTLQCNSVYCHSDGKGLAKLTPHWNETFAGLGGDRCAYCHSNSPSGTGAHAAHVVGIHYDDIFNGTSGTLAAGSNNAIGVSHGVATQATTLNCDICHAATVTNSRNLLNTACVSCHSTATDQAAIKRPLLNVANHVKGAPIIAFKDTTFTSKAQLRAGSFLNYTGGIAGWKRNAVAGVDQYKNGPTAYDISKNRLTIINWDATAKSCSNVVCHNQKPGQSVKWTDSLDCESCHKAL